MPPDPDSITPRLEIRLAHPDAVKSIIAERWLAAPEVAPQLGAVTLAPHQQHAAARLLELLDAHGGAVLADEAGMGKTFTALAVAHAFPRFHVVAPAALRDMWCRAMDRAGVHGDFHSFEALSRASAAPDEPVSLVILDEAHHARNPRAKRYRSLARLTWGARVLLLTATPVHNRLRDLRSQLALFLGTGAESLGADTVARLVVRRGHDAAQPAVRLPAVQPLQWLRTEPAPEVVRAIVDLPPPVPPADGGQAHALLRLGLVRAWSSSNAALRATLRHRLHQAAALDAALEAGRLPARRELTAWTALDDAVQLAFPELVSDHSAAGDVHALRAAITTHAEGVRRILDALAHAGDDDRARVEHLRRIRARHPEARMVAFTHFAETARALYRRLAGDGAVALVTARGARIASGPVSRGEILARLSPRAVAGDDRRLPLSLLIATDVLSEGLDLQQASVLVHLDLPWTPARFEQRLGRIRRLGSPHERIFTYAVGPPTGARELRTVVRALQRKLRLARSLVRPPDLSDLDALLQAPGVMQQDGLDLAGATERLQAALGAWRHAPCRPARATAGRAAEPLVAAAELPVMDEPWRALALATTGTRAHLAVLRPGGVSEHPASVLAFLHAEEQARARPAPRSDAIRTATRAAERWLAEQRGAAIVTAALDAPSPAHAAVLRWLDGLLARAGRHDRQSAGALVARCRDLVLRSGGAGAEDFLRHWLQSRAGPASRAGLLELATSLASRDLRQRTSRAAPELLALYVLVRADRSPPVATASAPSRSRASRYIVAAGPTVPAPPKPGCVTTPVHAA